jgi:NADH-quinone oxidoreductase subunit J
VTASWVVHTVAGALGLAAVVTGWLVFRTDSMVRASFWLLACFASVGAILVALNAQFLGFSVILMMAGEMAVMAIFMVMLMMNPAGLNPMTMVHQHTVAKVAGVAAFVGIASIGVLVDFPDRPATQEPAEVTAQLGVEELGESMLVFQTAGAVLLVTMVGSVAITSRRGRFGDAEDGSVPPPLDPIEPAP